METKPASSKIRQSPIVSAMLLLENETEISPLPASAGDSAEKPKKVKKWRRVKRKKHEHIPTEIMEIAGVKTLAISIWVQKILKCVVGDHVTSEYPWKYVQKELLEDNLELHEESSEFLPFKQEISVFPREEMLLIYIPDETREYDEFYICLTEAAEEAVLKIINNILEEREVRLNNSIWKNVGEWQTLGSEAEVEALQAKSNRPLLEVEIESEYPIKPTKCEFRLRLAENARDGYAEVVCDRQTFTNLQRKTLEVGIQVAPATAQNGSQTEYYRRNAFTQYEFEYPPIVNVSKGFQENIHNFLEQRMDGFADVMYVNSNIDFYENDYQNLVKDKRYTIIPISVFFKQYTSFSHPMTTKGKEIVCHSWHPMWSGIVAIAYACYKLSDYRKFDSNEDVVLDAIYDTTPVLLWSFQDNLDPKLFLETPTAISQLSWCPYDENLLVGGCANGQIVVWDITDALKNVEDVEILTLDQIGYRERMNSLMCWMKNTKDLKRIRYTVVSELEYSHGSRVSSITWLTTYREISKSGQMKDIPEEEDRTSLQFMTASNDGTVLAWDLKAKPVMSTSSYRPQRRLRRLQKRPSALTVAVSPYKLLNRIFKPIFKVNVLYPNSTRLLGLTVLNMLVAPIVYVEKYPDPNRVFNVTDRIIYVPDCKKPTHPCVNRFVAGSTEGDFIVASWEGFDFNSGEVVNKETCKFENLARYHDGPIVAVSRSQVFPDLILTVGGKVFALWNISFIGKPVLWRRSKYRFTHGVWNFFRPSIFRLSREDGYVEMWHLKTRSDRYTSLQFLGREGLGMCTTHPRTMQQNVIGVVAGKGSFELYYLSRDITSVSEEDKSSTYKICERELARKTKFYKWQSEWLLKHADQVKAKKEQELIIQQEKEQTLKVEKEQLKVGEQEPKREVSGTFAEVAWPESGNYSDWAHQQMILREKERMMSEILRLKQLDMDVLKKNRLPVIKLQEEDKKKKANLKKRCNIAGKLFDDTIAMLFPEAIEKIPPPPPDPYAGGDSKEVKIYHFENYTKLSVEYEDYIRERQYYYHFNWLALIQSGKERRRSFEQYFNRNNHRQRLIREKQEKQKKSIDYTYVPEEPTSLGSIEYIITSDESVGQEGVDVGIQSDE